MTNQISLATFPANSFSYRVALQTIYIHTDKGKSFKFTAEHNHLHNAIKLHCDPPIKSTPLTFLLTRQEFGKCLAITAPGFLPQMQRILLNLIIRMHKALTKVKLLQFFLQNE